MNPYGQSLGGVGGINLGLVSVNPLVSIQVTKDDYGEKVVKPFVNLHVTPNDFLLHKFQDFFDFKKGILLNNKHHHFHHFKKYYKPHFYGPYGPHYHGLHYKPHYHRKPHYYDPVVHSKPHNIIFDGPVEGPFLEKPIGGPFVDGPVFESSNPGVVYGEPGSIVGTFDGPGPVVGSEGPFLDRPPGHHIKPSHFGPVFQDQSQHNSYYDDPLNYGGFGEGGNDIVFGRTFNNTAPYLVQGISLFTHYLRQYAKQQYAQNYANPNYQNSYNPYFNGVYNQQYDNPTKLTNSFVNSNDGEVNIAQSQGNYNKDKFGQENLSQGNHGQSNYDQHAYDSFAQKGILPNSNNKHDFFFLNDGANKFFGTESSSPQKLHISQENNFPIFENSRRGKAFDISHPIKFPKNRRRRDVTSYDQMDSFTKIVKVRTDRKTENS